ncbi:MAG: armadillo-type fold-containing protein [Cyanobacteria bacterium P01_A01_bin.84]
MGQASYSWQQLMKQLSIASLKLPKSKNFREPGGVLALLTVVVAMLLWNWKLFLASSIGISSMILVYSIQDWDWQKLWFGLRSILSSPNRRLLLAVISGGIATFCTYMAAVICVESHNIWIATGAVLEGLATLLVLILLMWHIHSFYTTLEEKHFDRLLQQLTSQEALKRLVAVRQLGKFASTSKVDPFLQQIVSESFQLLLAQEREIIVREAALESLQMLDNSGKLESIADKKPISISLKAKPQLVQINYQ